MNRRDLLRLLTATAAGTGFALASVPSSLAAGFSLRGTQWAQVAALAGLDPYLLYAVGMVESRHSHRGKAQPWPFAVRTPQQSHYPTDYAAAVALLGTLEPEQAKDSDLGWMQVNVRWHGHRVPVLEHLLHPSINLRVGTGILAEALAATPGDLELAVGRYHTWMDEERGRAYGRRVLAIRAELRQAAGEPPYFGT